MKTLAFFAAVRLALTTVREHKLRSFLTVLGVIIGTGTIIGVLRSFGTDTAIVPVSSVIVGLTLYPAREAAKLDPINALRVEK